MVTLNKTITVNGISEVGISENRSQVAYMTANISADGNFSINRVIKNKEVFNANKEDVLADFLAFDEYVYTLSSETTVGKIE